MADVALKGCPFCNGEAEIERYGTRKCSTIYNCNWCGCRLETGEERNHGDKWNTRAPSPEAEAMAEALAAIIETLNGRVHSNPALSALHDGLNALSAYRASQETDR